MLGYLLAVCWFAFVAVHVAQLRRPLAKKTKMLLLVSATAMLAMTVVQLNATREQDSVKVKIGNIKAELDQIEQEGQSGRQFSAKELQDRKGRLEQLQARLNALRR
jgi:glucan phosphoethanolaminetransferase (alkaline phosphatase superfamily)